MYTISDFNSTVFDLVQDLNAALPDHPELSVAASLASTFFKLHPENRLVLDKFWEYATAHKESIDTRDTDTLLHVLGQLVPQTEVVASVWTSLSDENRDTVFSYIQHLYEQARLIHEAEAGATDDTATATTDAAAAALGAAGAAQGYDAGQHLFLVYNNIWKEFLEHLRATVPDGDAKVKDELDKTCERLTKLMEAKGDGSSVVFELMNPILADALPAMTAFNEQQLMMHMIPPEDPSSILHHDQETLAGKRFVLACAMTMTELLEAVITSDDMMKLGMYWHYIKIMTFTLKSCPPELLEMMGNLSKSLVSSVV